MKIILFRRLLKIFHKLPEFRMQFENIGFENCNAIEAVKELGVSRGFKTFYMLSCAFRTFDGWK